jgi:hypothetical protein
MFNDFLVKYKNGLRRSIILPAITISNSRPSEKQASILP